MTASSEPPAARRLVTRTAMGWRYRCRGCRNDILYAQDHPGEAMLCTGCALLGPAVHDAYLDQTTAAFLRRFGRLH
jgi:hypothetical protein